MTTSGRPSWLDRAVDEALTVCPTVAPWEMRLALIAAAPTIQNAATTDGSARTEWAARREFDGYVIKMRTEDSARQLIADESIPMRLVKRSVHATAWEPADD